MEEERIDAMIDGEPGAFGSEGSAPATSGPDRQRTPVTILFSDIKGSTTYFEQKGDLEGLAMLERHNNLLLPCVEQNNGQLVKTIGDALMTRFGDPADAVRAAVCMQNVLFKDGNSRPDSERIRIRIGIHTGVGLVRGDDVFGDVVNAAAKIQTRSLPDQILITDSVVPAAQEAGYQVAKLERTRLEGKEEIIDVYAVGWSAASTQRLIDDLYSRYEERLREMKEIRSGVEDELDQARAEWRAERRRLHAEIERLEDEVRDASSSARDLVTEEFRSELRSELNRVSDARLQAERDLEDAHERFEAERVGYRAQIETLERRLLEALERANNPRRLASETQREVEDRVERAKKQWQVQWEEERRRLLGELEALRSSRKHDPLADARRLVEERVKASLGGSDAVPDSASEVLDQVREERDSLRARVQALEAEMATLNEATRREVARELRYRYDQRAEQADRIRAQLEQELNAEKREHEAETTSLSERIRQLEEALPAAQESARVQAQAEMRSELQSRLDDAVRLRAGLERRRRDDAEEWDLERRRLLKQLETLEERLEEARDMVFQRSSEPTLEELGRLRRELGEELAAKKAAWEEERGLLLEQVRRLEGEHG